MRVLQSANKVNEEEIRKARFTLKDKIERIHEYDIRNS